MRRRRRCRRRPRRARARSRIRKGVGTAPCRPIAAFAAETPKIRVGIISGRTMHGEDQAAAAQRGRQRRPDRADEGERRGADQEGRDHGDHASRRQGDQQPEERRREGERQAGRQPVGQRPWPARRLRAAPARGAGGRGTRPPRRPGRAGRGRSGSRARRASQRIAGPMRERRLRSGPSAKGISVTIMRKKTSPSAPEPPMRAASFRSRARRARKAARRHGATVLPRAAWNGAFDADVPRAARPSGCVGRRDDQAALGEMPVSSGRASISCEPASRAAVGSSRSQSGRVRDEEARQRDAPALAGRQIGDRQRRAHGRGRRRSRASRGRQRRDRRGGRGRRRGFPPPSGRLSGRRDGRRGAGIPAGCARRRPRAGPTRQPAAGARPGWRAASTCRRRCGRCTTSASPGSKREGKIVEDAGGSDRRQARFST